MKESPPHSIAPQYAANPACRRGRWRQRCNSRNDTAGRRHQRSHRRRVRRAKQDHSLRVRYGIPNADIVRCAFTHANEFGSRFNDATRGAWYASDALDTSVAEVVYHKAKRLGEIVVPDLPQNKPDSDVSTHDDWLADFKAAFHVLEPPEQYADCLQPEPVPFCYGSSQTLARALLQQKSCGLVYRSVRRPGFDCIVCFRPALVYNPTRGERLELTLTANDIGYTPAVRAVPIEPSSLDT